MSKASQWHRGKNVSEYWWAQTLSEVGSSRNSAMHPALLVICAGRGAYELLIQFTGWWLWGFVMHLEPHQRRHDPYKHLGEKISKMNGGAHKMQESRKIRVEWSLETQMGRVYERSMDTMVTTLSICSALDWMIHQIVLYMVAEVLYMVKRIQSMSCFTAQLFWAGAWIRRT